MLITIRKEKNAFTPFFKTTYHFYMTLGVTEKKWTHFLTKQKTEK